MGSGGRANSVLLSSDWHMKNFEGQKGFELIEAREYSRLGKIPAKVMDSNGGIKTLFIFAKSCS